MSRSLKRAFSLIALAFLCTFTWLGFVVHRAFRDYEPVLDTGYYRKGLEYTERHRALKRSQTEGWKLSSAVFAKPELLGGEHRVEFLVENTHGRKIEQAELSVILERPASLKERQSYKVDLAGSQARGTGRAFPLTLTISGTGQWELRVEASINGEVAIFKSHRFAAVGPRTGLSFVQPTAGEKF